MGHDERAERYARLVATIPEARLKGAKMPDTSVNGNMYSYLGEHGVSLRLPVAAREEFIERYRTSLTEAHGVVQREYVTVPDDLLARLDELAPVFRLSFDHAQSLRPKAKSRAVKR